MHQPDRQAEGAGQAGDGGSAGDLVRAVRHGHLHHRDGPPVTCCECGEAITELPDLDADWSAVTRLVHVDSQGRYLKADHHATEGPCERRGWWRRKVAA